MQLQSSKAAPHHATTGIFHEREAASAAVHRFAAQQKKEDSTVKKQGLVFGVVLPCLSNILGVLLFIRLPFIVGKAGIYESMYLVALCCTVTLHYQENRFNFRSLERYFHSHFQRKNKNTI